MKGVGFMIKLSIVIPYYKTYDETQKLMLEQRMDEDPFLLFLNQEEVITIDGTSQCTTKELWMTYNAWASVNGYYTYGSVSRFSRDIKPKLLNRPGVSENPNAKSYEGNRARGYNGVMIHHEKKRLH